MLEQQVIYSSSICWTPAPPPAPPTTATTNQTHTTTKIKTTKQQTNKQQQQNNNNQTFTETKRDEQEVAKSDSASSPLAVSRSLTGVKPVARARKLTKSVSEQSLFYPTFVPECMLAGPSLQNRRNIFKSQHVSVFISPEKKKSEKKNDLAIYDQNAS